MPTVKRPSFLLRACAAFIAAAPLAPAAATTGDDVSSGFVHHVYFWLNHPDSEVDRAALIEGLRTLSAAIKVRQFHIGVPAGTSRDVIDRSYAVSWMLVFDDRADQDAYQIDPAHLRFVEERSKLWKKVIVYDTEPVNR